MQLNEESSVRAFYGGKTILVTGGTGFLGKVLIEKLLRTCSEIKRIYVLIRTKKGYDARQRVEKMLDDPVFARLKNEAVDYHNKIRPISGDMSLPGLGLSTADMDELIQEVDIVLNVAANVRFDESLKSAILINVRGTDEIMKLSRRIAHLKVVMHVSTMFSNCILDTVDEVFYKPPIPGTHAIKFSKTLPDVADPFLEDPILGQYPNTYVYTKCIAEDLVREYGNELPVGIFRPAIITCAYNEPAEGWIDNWYGPTGVGVGIYLGLLKTMLIDANGTVQLVPVDYTANALIAATWAVANQKLKNKGPIIYNYPSAWNNRLNWGEFINVGIKCLRKNPSMKAYWCYNFIVTKNVYLHYIIDYFLQYIPILLVDSYMFLRGRKERYLHLYRKFQKGVNIVNYFCLRNWNFSCDNTKTLWKELNPNDRALFPFSLKDFDWHGYTKKYANGVRLYLLKEDPSTIPQARKRMRRLEAIHAVIKYSIMAFACWFLYYVTRVLLHEN